ncbi:uncharacterized protein MKK02DRAFT_29890 [Dioszegia hungarica]|uniref:Uncharacterized protein n=1 Tax=Dioszegia hungarica TaxID=4972 RepID=A0AA38H2P6_9TREE|nr:uncharacterized protein MKK02DRAFT_29890 [Dioszegia hungarica]KAI9633098.1 hypothetical protein MKK02DRAFT_29890 [Dioszegia hungarica]
MLVSAAVSQGFTQSKFSVGLGVNGRRREDRKERERWIDLGRGVAVWQGTCTSVSGASRATRSYSSTAQSRRAVQGIICIGNIDGVNRTLGLTIAAHTHSSRAYGGSKVKCAARSASGSRGKGYLGERASQDRGLACKEDCTKKDFRISCGQRLDRGVQTVIHHPLIILTSTLIPHIRSSITAKLIAPAQSSRPSLYPITFTNRIKSDAADMNPSEHLHVLKTAITAASTAEQQGTDAGTVYRAALEAFATYVSQIAEDDAKVAQSIESAEEHNQELERLLAESETEIQGLRKRVDELEGERTVCESQRASTRASTWPGGTFLQWLLRPRVESTHSRTEMDER